MRSNLKPLEQIEIPFLPQARWSRLIGYIALPVMVIGGLSHRFGLMDTTAFLAVSGTAILLAAIALALSIWSFSEIWRLGDRGFADATRGLLSSLIALTPAAIASYMVLTKPRISEISTDISSPPQFIALRLKSEQTAGSKARSARRGSAYTDIGTRRFDVPPQTVYDAAETAAKDAGWEFLYRLRPAGEAGEGRIEAFATTFVFGFIDEVVVRIRPDPRGSRIDIRSKSRIGAHDLGANAQRIRGFFRSLDSALKLAETKSLRE